MELQLVNTINKGRRVENCWGNQDEETFGKTSRFSTTCLGPILSDSHSHTTEMTSLVPGPGQQLGFVHSSREAASEIGPIGVPRLDAPDKQ